MLTPELRASLVRGLFHALVVAATAFFTAWTDPSIPTRTLVSVSVLPALAVLGSRFIGEGWKDSAAAAKPGTPEHAARVARSTGTGT